jgi:hypothetical protein
MVDMRDHTDVANTLFLTHQLQNFRRLPESWHNLDLLESAKEPLEVLRDLLYHLELLIYAVCARY